MHSLVLLALWTFVVVAVAVSDSGDGKREIPDALCLGNERRRGKIVGGSDAAEGDFPFMVSLTRRGQHFCGASIIHERFLLTAGHCLCNGLGRPMKPTQIQAMVGLHKQTNDVSEEHQVTIKEIVFHPDYNCHNVDNDIALLELSKPLTFRDDKVRSTCLAANPEEDFVNHTPIVIGWGWTNEDRSLGSRAETLQKAKVSVWTQSECQKSFENNKKLNKIQKTQICAGHKSGGVDSCWADSGGPLVHNNLLIGIVSTGVGCARPGLPGIYTRVTEYVNWIQQHAI